MASPSDTTPCATIVVSGRAEPALLPRALASVRAQTEAALEIVVVATAQAMDDLRRGGLLDDARVQTLLDEDALPAAALDAALARARAPWAKILPATAVLAPDCLARELAAVASEPRASAVFSLPELVDENDQRISDPAVVRSATPAARDGRALRLELIERRCIAPATALFSVAAARAIGGCDAEMVSELEHDLWLRLCHHGPAVVLPEQLARVRWQPQRTETTAAQIERIDSLHRLLTELRAHGWRAPEDDAATAATPAPLLDLARAIQRSGFLELAPFARELAAQSRALGVSLAHQPGLAALLGSAPELTRPPAWCDQQSGVARAEAATPTAFTPAAAVLLSRIAEITSAVEAETRERARLDGIVEGLAADVATARVLAERTRDVSAQVLDKLRVTRRLASGTQALLGVTPPTAQPAPAAHDAAADGRQATPTPDRAALEVAPSEHAGALREIVERHAACRGTVLFAPTLRWSHALFQRPHQLARELARQGYLVFYIEGLWPKPGEGGFEKLGDGLYAACVPLDVFAPIDAPIVFFLSYNALDLDCLTQPRSVYELIDELEVFGGDQAAIVQSHDRLLASADVVVATARKLQRRIAARRPDAILSPNAVEYAHFHRARQDLAIPPDLARLLRPRHAVVGYYGALAAWLDYELIRHAAHARPDLEFVLIGPDYDGSLATSDVLELANVHRLDSRPYEVLPSYLRAFDVAMIPFVVNEITESTSPIKLFEYMAAGKPVLTTPMHECRLYAGVLIADDGAHFVHLIDRALELGRDPAYLEQIDGVARANTWTVRVEQILKAIASCPRASERAVRTPRQAAP